MLFHTFIMIWLYSFVECLFKSFAHFLKLDCLFFLLIFLITFYIILYILGSSPLVDI